MKNKYLILTLFFVFINSEAFAFFLEKNQYYRLPIHLDGRDVELFVLVENVKKLPNKTNSYKLELIQIEDKTSLLKQGTNFVTQKILGKKFFSDQKIKIIEGVTDASLLEAMMQHSKFKTTTGTSREDSRTIGAALAAAFEPLRIPSETEEPLPKSKAIEKGFLESFPLIEKKTKNDVTLSLKNTNCGPAIEGKSPKPPAKPMTLAKSVAWLDKSEKSIRLLSESNQSGSDNALKIVNFVENGIEKALKHSENKLYETCYLLGGHTARGAIDLIKEINKEDLKISAQTVGELFFAGADGIEIAGKIGLGQVKGVTLDSLPDLSKLELLAFKIPKFNFNLDLPALKLFNFDLQIEEIFSEEKLEKLQNVILSINNEIESLGNKAEPQLLVLRVKLNQVNKKAEAMSKDEKLIYFHRLKSIAKEAFKIYETQVNTSALATRISSQLKNANINVTARLKSACIDGVKLGALNIKGLKPSDTQDLQLAAKKALDSIKKTAMDARAVGENVEGLRKTSLEIKGLASGGKNTVELIKNTLELVESGKDTASQSDLFVQSLLKTTH